MLDETGQPDLGETNCDPGRALPALPDLAALEEVVSSIRSDALRVPASAFLASMSRIGSLLLLPYLVAGEGARTLLWGLEYATLLRDHGRVDERNPVLIEQAHRKLATPANRDLLTNDIEEIIRGTIRQVMPMPKVREAFELMHQVVIILTWSAFESLARDAWEAMINVLGTSYQHRALLGLDEIDAEASAAVTRRNISVGVLASHHFDLRGKMGTILVNKYRFTCAEGIQSAYRAAFGCDVELDELFTSELQRGEKIRHLIIHRAGIIDDKFAKEMGSEFRVGDRIDLVKEDVESILQSVLGAGDGLIRHLDRLR